MIQSPEEPRIMARHRVKFPIEVYNDGGHLGLKVTFVVDDNLVRVKNNTPKGHDLFCDIMVRCCVMCIDRIMRETGLDIDDVLARLKADGGDNFEGIKVECDG
jgi:hypothetical protein